MSSAPEAFEPFKDRVKVYQILNDNKIETPRYIVCDRSDLENMPEFEEFDDYLEINGETFHKPFVEKPVRYDQNYLYQIPGFQFEPGIHGRIQTGPSSFHL